MKEKIIIKKLKKTIGKLLYNLIQEYDCIIAGGCIRDIILGKKPKDIDIFFISSQKYYNFMTTLRNVHKILPSLDYPEVNKVAEVFHVKAEKNIPIDVDLVLYNESSLSEITKNFDVSINMLYFYKGKINGQPELNFSAEFIINQIKNREMSIGGNQIIDLLNNKVFTGTKERIERFKKDFKFDSSSELLYLAKTNGII